VNPLRKPFVRWTLLVLAGWVVLVTLFYAQGDWRDGHAWQEAQLVALEKQLKRINLFPFVAEAIYEERAVMRPCPTIEIETGAPSETGDRGA
jgi:hypothetical protein